MNIRDFTQQDKEIYYVMSKDFYSGFATLEEGSIEQYEATFKMVMKNSPYVRGLILEMDQQIVGYALLGFFWSNGNESITILIDELYICPQMRGQNCGRKFFQWLEANYDIDDYTFTLEVNPRNEKALAFYEKLGYKRTEYIVMEKY